MLHSLPITYNGSKQRIFKWVAGILLRESVDSQVAVDGFSGSGIISSLLADSGLEVHSSDSLFSAYAMTVTLAGNPGITMTDGQLDRIISHSCVDGMLYDDETGLVDDIPNVNDVYPGIFTRNEGIWMGRTREKLNGLPVYERLIGQVALRSLACIQPFGTPNGRSTFVHRIKQKRKYGNNCLGHYLNSSYEIEMDTWFRRYVGKFNAAVDTLSSGREGCATCHRTDVLRLLEETADLGVGVAYFDPPYGGPGCRDYGIDYQVHEHIIGAEPLPTSDFFTAAGHAAMFDQMLDRCEGIPTVIFSYNNKAWATIDDIVARLKHRGYAISVESVDHVHGKHPIDDCQNNVTEHMIIAKR